MATIEASDVIRILEQYLKENNLLKTLQALQDETDVCLNTVDSIETFVNDVNSGQWDVVLRTVKLLKIPDNKLIDLYEQITIELIELREIKAAHWLIHKTAPLLKLKTTSPERYLHLQSLLSRSFFDPKEAYRDLSSKERRRAAIANDLKKEVNVAPPQRLLTLIGDALKWQKHEGLLTTSGTFDIFTGKARMVEVEEETFPNELHKHCVKPVTSSDADEDEPSIFVCCAEFSPDGHHIVIGYSTGLIEVRNPVTGRLSNDLKYQAQQNFIVTPSKKAALSICFSVNELFAIGDKSGDISIWKLETGQLVQIFKSAHVKSVSSLLFHRNGREILSGGHDGSVKLHGMRSNKTIRDYKGHKLFVYGLAFSRDDNCVLSGGADATVKIWNVKTTQLLHEYKSPSRVHSIIPVPNSKNDLFIIGDRSRSFHLIDLEGKVRLRIVDEPVDDRSKEKLRDKKSQEKNDEHQLDFYASCSSPKGNWLYAVDSKNICCFNYSTKKMLKKLSAHDEINNDLIGIKHHPFMNLIATFDTRGNLKLWKP